MAMHTTVVYYSQDEPKLKAFHLANIINKTELEEALKENEVHTIYSITVEKNTIGLRRFNIIYTESEIQAFLNEMGVSF